MNRSELIKSKCWSCWWREGFHCFSEDFGEIPTREWRGMSILKGYDITLEHLEKCNGSKIEKRDMLPIPKEKLIILSEFANK